MRACNNEPDGYCHSQHVSGTLISHGFFVQHTGASQLSPPLAIGTLIQTMVEAAVRTLLVTATGVASCLLRTNCRQASPQYRCPRSQERQIKNIARHSNRPQKRWRKGSLFESMSATGDQKTFDEGTTKQNGAMDKKTPAAMMRLKTHCSATVHISTLLSERRHVRKNDDTRSI